MTAEEYLSTLQTLAREFAHSEPVPKQNDTWADTLEKMLPQELRKEVYAVSEQVAGDNFKQVYGSELPESDYPGGWAIEQLERLFKLYNDRMQSDDIPHVKLGILPIGSMDAASLKVPDSSEYLIVFNEGALLYLYLFAKAILAGRTADPFSVTSETRLRIEDLLSNYLFQGRPENAQCWVPAPHLLVELDALIGSAELFILCHEMAHILSGNFLPIGLQDLLAQKQKVPNTLMKKERTADLIGARLTIATIGPEVGLKHALDGIHLAICARAFVENGIKVLHGLDVPTTAIGGNRRTHALIQSLIPGVAALGPDAPALVAASGSAIPNYAQRVWESILPWLTGRKNNGAIPATVWSPLQ